jgi:CheY-like chemotaxis protein
MSAGDRFILLVEDDRFLRRACEVSLRRRGFSVRTAEDGETALESVRTELPDLILLDLLMPKMTGVEVLRALRADEHTRGVRVLVLSNSSRGQDVKEIGELGVEGYLVKADLSLQQLGDRVAKLMEA